MGIGQLRRPDALVVGGIQLAVADVVHHRAGEEVGFLKHHAQRVAQIGLGDLVDVDVVVADLAVGNVIEPVNEVRNGGLARAGSAHEGDLLAGMGIERHVMKHRFLRHIAKVHVRHGDVALQLRVGHGAVCLVGMLPGPMTGALFGFRNIALVVDFRVDQSDIALVLLGLLVHQLKNPLGAGQSHDDGVDLVGHLGNGHIEGAGQGQEADKLAQGQQAAAGGHRQQTAYDGKNGVLGIAQVVVQGAHAVGIGTGKIGVLAKLLVQLIELRLAHILVGENLHHPLAVDHFLHIAVHRAQGTLLADEELGGFSRDQLGDKHHRQHGNQLEHRQDG